MIIKINGRDIDPKPCLVPEPEYERCDSSYHYWNVVEEPTALQKAFEVCKPAIMAGVFAIPKDAGIATKLMPLALKLQEFALPAAVCVSLWGLCMYIFGDPAGKEKIRQALIGFIGVFTLPMIFFAIWEAFRG